MGLSVRFWGVRGSIACPLSQYMAYGETPRASVRAGDQRIILDAGTGIRGLGNSVLGDGIKQAVLLFTHARSRIELTPRPDAGRRQVRWNHPIGGDRVVAAYAGAGQRLPRSRSADPAQARVDYVYQVNRRKIELIASLQLFARGDDLSTATLSLPAQFDVQARKANASRIGGAKAARSIFVFVGDAGTDSAHRLPRAAICRRAHRSRRASAGPRWFQEDRRRSRGRRRRGVEAAMKLSGDARKWRRTWPRRISRSCRPRAQAKLRVQEPDFFRAGRAGALPANGGAVGHAFGPSSSWNRPGALRITSRRLFADGLASGGLVRTMSNVGATAEVAQANRSRLELQDLYIS